MSIRLGTNIISGRSTYQPSLFDYKWTDYAINDPQWARGDNFSWHNSTIYTAAYNHLVADIEGKTPQADQISGIYITYYLANDGHKICMPDQEEFLNQLYNATGSAWYYMLDTVTGSFKVPRERPESTLSGKALYFYIGNFTQTALENTAGANLADIEDAMDDAVDTITGLADNITTAIDSKITNCITEIPQDIKLELNNGTLTLKAGSKVYIPNGSGVFNTRTIASDFTLHPQLYNDKKMPVIFADGYGMLTLISHASGTIASRPAASTSYSLYYATDENKCYFDDGSWHQCSFPIALVSRNNSVGYYSIDQVFNGFGVVGATVFVLPGVKALAANDRNSDGTLKNIEFTVSSVCVAPRTWNDTTTQQPLILWADGTIFYAERYVESETMPYPNIYTVWYQPSSNILRSNISANNVDKMDTVSIGVCYGYAGYGTDIDLNVFKVPQDFRAVDYNSTNVDFVVASQLPTSSNNYTWYRKYKSGWVEQGGRVQLNGVISATNKLITFPVTMYNTNYYSSIAQDANVGMLTLVGWQTTTGMTVGTASGSSTGWTSWEVKGYAA